MMRSDKSMGRAAQDLQAKLLGRQALRYHFEIIPKAVEGLQLPGAEQVSVVWEKGAKISYTDPSSVDARGTAEFSQVMRQTATIYQQDDALLPKEYSFKVQTVKQSTNRLLASSETRRKTVARAKLNLSQFCTPGAAAPATSEVAVQLQPAGLLRLQIRAVWLQHCSRPGAGRISETGSFTDVSSQHSSENESLDGDDAAAGGTGTVDRTASLDMDYLTDYASHSSTRHTSSLSAAATAHYNAPAGPAAPSPTAAAAAGSARSLKQSASLPAAVTAAGGRPGSRSPDWALGSASASPSPSPSPSAGGGRHRRTLSSPEHDMQPIEEAEREGLDTALSLERSASGQHSAVAAAVAAASAPHDDADAPAADGLRSLSSHLPSWLWPFSRDAVRGATTDQLMRQIAAAEDVGKLQQLCRGLLCERNDWRYKATQLDRQVQQLQAANTNLLQQLGSLEAQVGQLQQDSLVDRLVEAKLALAQADLANTAAKGALTKERERSRQWAAKFTTLQVMYESLLEQEAAREGGYAPGAVGAYAAGAVCTTPEASRRSSVDGGDQGEGLSALGQGAAGVVRKLSSTSWAGFWAPAAAGGAGGSSSAGGVAGHARRLSNPSDDAVEPTAAERRIVPRHSIA